MTGDDMPRPLSVIERDVIARLLSVPFPGRDELRAQLPFARVEGRCGCGCVTVNLAVDRAAAPAAVSSSAPVSADISDDEFYAGVVLLVDGEGYLCCLVRDSDRTTRRCAANPIQPVHECGVVSTVRP
ncbi:hypothetical protein [Micromonospora lupini]|uniref:Uncharacterized protein n=1 Tax=Micromonospora lupini str. Lupac 08 TaxID=1150864 RepID=I0L1K8_9ACTN|nr:hypothetical protein [Micromonospora lupini]CCH17705.1 Conserved hypothetical protein [Micromonospora lupini str. Lupac 08]